MVGLYVTCDAHFRTWMSYSSQKSCVNIWLGFVEPVKELSFEFSRGGGGKGRVETPYYGVTCDLWSPFSNLAELFQSKVMCENLVRIGWAFQELSCPQTFFLGGQKPPLGEGCMWPAMPIFELARGFLDKSNVWKSGSDWLRLSRVIVCTKKKKKINK